MNIAYICIIISIFIPLSCAGYAKFSVKGYNNKMPRLFLSNLDGAAQRANFAQQNFYETFPAFAVGVIAAHQMNAPLSCINAIAVTYVISRICYAVFYIKDMDIYRSVSWAVSLIAILSLYITAII